MKLDYDLLIAETPPPRQERLNLGLIVWRDGHPEIHADVSARRLAALDPNYPRMPIFRQLIDGTLTESIRQSLSELPDIESRRSLLGFLLPPLKTVPGGELFSEGSDSDFTPAIERVMQLLVRLQPITVRIERSAPRASRLETQLRTWLRSAKLLGRTMDELSRNRVVAQYPVSIEADVYADFAFKNGSLNVIETLDLRGVDHVTSALRNTAAFKSITLDMARDVVGENGKRLGVVAAGDYGSVKSAIRLFERNTDELYALDSADDAQRLADRLASGLHLSGGLLKPVRLLERA